jgi:hypothetical protein
MRHFGSEEGDDRKIKIIKKDFKHGFGVVQYRLSILGRRGYN